MKFTVVFVTLLSISAPWLVMGKKVDDVKDKREAPVSYDSSAGHSSSSYQPSQAYQGSQAYQPSQAYQSSQAYQPSQVYQAAQSYEPASAGHGDASAISVGAGYSIGGAKPNYSFGGQGGISALQIPADGLQSSGHNTIQLPPITLQPNHGAGLVGTDLNQLMSQLTQSINSGALSLSPSNSIAEFHSGAKGIQGAQELAVPQYSYPNLQQYNLGSLGAGSYAGGAQSFSAATPTFTAAAPIYAAGSKGLSSYGSTGPVLFNPSEGHAAASGLAYTAPSSGHSLGDSGALSLGGSGHALSGLSLGGSGHSFGGSLKSLGVPSKSFTPSVFLGASSDSSHSLGGAEGSYKAPSFEGFSSGHNALSLGSGSHGPSYAGSFNGFGGDAAKFAAPSFGSFKSESYGSPSEALAAFSANGHSSSPSNANFGFATSSYPIGATHAASAAKPYYVSTSKHPGGGSSSFRGPSSSHSSLNAHSSGPKYSFGGHNSARYSPKDAYGAHSETSYNTIKYSEELKPRIH
ncbi:hypothetical protein O3G_MSEX001637 [Manduca sexta]|uniref:Uncharacterized protein n=1 Tax=Manduca sexta TaxID=7130 RepID=A0A921YLP7_MANSE|nr:hypothetical protein O3G_MSEX001637 [Manduca sexta]